MTLCATVGQHFDPLVTVVAQQFGRRRIGQGRAATGLGVIHRLRDVFHGAQGEWLLVFGDLDGGHIGAVVGALVGRQTLGILPEVVEFADDLLVARVVGPDKGLGVGAGVAAQFFQSGHALLQQCLSATRHHFRLMSRGGSGDGPLFGQRLFQFGQTSAASGHLFGVVLLPVLDRILHPLCFAAIGGALQLTQGADDLLEIAALEVADAALNGLFEQLVTLGQQRAGFCLMGRRGVVEVNVSTDCW